MDEQAAEREQERDDFVHEIKRLQELLRDKERDRSSQQQINHEVNLLLSKLPNIAFMPLCHPLFPYWNYCTFILTKYSIGVLMVVLEILSIS